jgi:nitrogen regulatory protein PII
MSYLVVLIVDNPEDCPQVLDAWEELGVTGVTILESTGLGRHRRAALREELPLMPSLVDFLSVREEPHRTLLSVVESQELVDRMVAEAQKVIGNLDDPHTGFLFVVPVLHAYGLGRGRQGQV